MVSKMLVFVLIVGTASAATWIGRLPQKPREFADQEGCYIPELRQVVPFNTEITPIGQCVRMQCLTNMIDYASCGAVGTDDPNCHITDEDTSKPYPNCCPDIKCDLDNNLF